MKFGSLERKGFSKFLYFFFRVLRGWPKNTRVLKERRVGQVRKKAGHAWLLSSYWILGRRR